MLNSSLTSIENLRNNLANIKEEAIGLAKKWGITLEFEKKRHRKVGQFFDDFNADEKLQDSERLLEVNVFKANVDVITTQLKNRFESMNGIYKSFSILSPKNILFYMNEESATIALRKFRVQKNVKSRKGPLTPAGLLKLVKRFEETGKLEDRARADDHA
ncbi:hypothetical protein TNCV_4974671 [Trichonephila clavipes]|uniref:DUF4817 domain-containing protein n=1 Tax=Trichonephila clavipes TaxID=2585209 RepID=A0A8X6SMY2_TRICX|nr:hypothetical protein TNCV_4974671 [Trichonephila clavipes]